MFTNRFKSYDIEYIIDDLLTILDLLYTFSKINVNFFKEYFLKHAVLLIN